MDMKNLESARSFLAEVGSELISNLLEFSSYKVVVQEDDWWTERVFVDINSPPAFSRALSSLGASEKERIFRAIAAHDPRVPDDSVSADQVLFSDAEGEDIDPSQELLAELVCQREVLIDVATGSARINDVNDYFKARRNRIREGLNLLEVEDPWPFDDLWAWYNKWRAEGWDSWAERREYVHQLFDPVIQQLLREPPEPAPAREPTGWDRVDRSLAKARVRIGHASAEEDFQTVGLLCREVLISLGQAAYDPANHRTPDGVDPSPTDAKRLLEAFLGSTVPGETNETVRRHAKASLSLALELQHRRSADFRAAALCLEATSSTVNVVAILAGKRDR